MEANNAAVLELQDGTIISGLSFGAPIAAFGECVFQTGMVGYVESITDPSYFGQILVLSYPLIGNYGVPSDTQCSDLTRDSQHPILEWMESSHVQIAGLVVSDYCHEEYSHSTAVESLGSWLTRNNVPAIYNVDTRSLIKKLRDHGSCLAKLYPKSQRPQIEILPFVDPNLENLVEKVSCKAIRHYRSIQLPSQDGTTSTSSANYPKIIAVDYGMKNNQIRCLLRHPIELEIVPYDYPLSQVDPSSFQGLFLSNGPGDPALLSGPIDQLRRLLAHPAMAEKPVFGVCLGNQLLALAVNANTYKLKFGNRGQNQPCIDLTTNRCHLTMQNHGFAVDPNTLPDGWEPYFVNANDGTNEGIRHKTKPWSAVQFHPEAKSGPMDTLFLLEKFVASACNLPFNNPLDRPYLFKGLIRKPHKVLLLGSGGLSIGQAGEFDYSGSQAIKALRLQRMQVILINPNIATVQTNVGLADKVYFLPVTPEHVKQVIEDERPDSILLQFGGQTALNCGTALHHMGVFSQYNVQILGTSIESIICTEDRNLFANKLKEINQPVAPSIPVSNIQEALAAIKKIGYPVIIRSGFSLGGLGSGFASNEDELIQLVTPALIANDQLLIERSLKGWKEIEYEVVRDQYDNCVTVCNMENMDPLGIHTGESIVVAPSQTLNDREYHLLRTVSLQVVRYLEIIGECNIQFALDPNSEQYYIVEVNARLSRSSALASKATGYPLAFVAAQLVIGKSLPELRNLVTNSTTACWEPSLDYIIVKMPRWDLTKFSRISTNISTSMKSVGEVMSIGRRFEEAIQKAIRMINPPVTAGFNGTRSLKINHQLKAIEDSLGLSATQSDIEAKCRELINQNLRHPSDERIFVIAQAFQRQYTVEQVHQETMIDRWFLHKLFSISQFYEKLHVIGNQQALDSTTLLWAKCYGFSDKQIATCVNSTEMAIRNYRLELNIMPIVKYVDTVSAEFPMQSDVNYMYMTYNGSEDDMLDPETYEQENESISTILPPTNSPPTNTTSVPSSPSHSSPSHLSNPQSLIVLGSGAYSIGSSVEFDWCAVGCIRTCKELGYNTIMVNYNPETVSTDYDECDRLYFEELSVERIMDIYERERPKGIIVCMGGQIPNNISMALSRAGANILGTNAEMIETAENRYKFSRLLDTIKVDQPKWKECRNFEETMAFCQHVSFPCLVRPSFVLSGAGMTVVHSKTDLANYLQESQAMMHSDSPVVISKFITKAKEVDVDAVASQGELIIYSILDHIEDAGIHSGDAIMMLPAHSLDSGISLRILATVTKIVKHLNVTGPLNIQFIIKGDAIMVIECNLRASRTLPFVSKTVLVNFGKVATEVMLGVKVRPFKIDDKLPYVGLKVPQFSFLRLQGADPVVGVDMSSTGEVAGFGRTKYEAFFKAFMATGFKWPTIDPSATKIQNSALISIGAFSEKKQFLPYAKMLVSLGFKLYGSTGTSDFMSEHDVPITALHWHSSNESCEMKITELISNSLINLCILLPSKNRFSRSSSFYSNGYLTRCMAIERSIPLVTNLNVAQLLVGTMFHWLLPNQHHLMDISEVDVRSGKGVYVRLPGLYDVHVHMRQPGGDHKEDWDSGTSAALTGGFTFVAAMPNTNPAVTSADNLLQVHRLARENARCDYGIYVGANNTNTIELSNLLIDHASGQVDQEPFDSASALHPGTSASPMELDPLQTNKPIHYRPLIFGLKMYLDPTYTTLQLNSLAEWMPHFQNWPADMPLCVHAEGHNIAAALMLANLYKRSVHICHIAHAEEIELVRKAKESGSNVTCEVTPHHLFLCQEEMKNTIIDHSGSSFSLSDFHVCPRIGSQADREALWANLDIIDVIATDHAPHTWEEKTQQFGRESKTDEAHHGMRHPPGYPGLETSLALMLTAVHQRRLTLDILIAKMHVNPRRIFNLPAQPNTWIEVNMSERWIIPEKMPYSKSGWTPFAGMEVIGKVERVFLHGKLAMADDQVIAPRGFGKNLCARRTDTSPSITSSVIMNDLVERSNVSTSISVPSFTIPESLENAEKVESSPRSLNANTEPFANTSISFINQLPLSASTYLSHVPSTEYIDPSPIPNSRPITPPFLSKFFNGSTDKDDNNLANFNMSNNSYTRTNHRHVISVLQYSRSDLHQIFTVANYLKTSLLLSGSSLDILRGKVLANVFYEPSTRTMCSFHTAMTRLGGSVLPFNPDNSSVIKGESFSDTIRTLSAYADLIVVRHPEVGSAQLATTVSSVPVINAGDGIGEHPTQALLDVFTIRQEMGTVNGLHYTFVGDLKNGRTVHSLVQLLSLYSNIHITYIAPDSLQIPQHVWDQMAKNTTVTQFRSTQLDESLLKTTDVLYLTRIQKERFADDLEYEKVSGLYTVTPKTLTHVKEKMVLMHPLPRIKEIDPILDSDPRSAYFRQSENGLYIRMAVLLLAL